MVTTASLQRRGNPQACGRRSLFIPLPESLNNPANLRHQGQGAGTGHGAEDGRRREMSPWYMMLKFSGLLPFI